MDKWTDILTDGRLDGLIDRLTYGPMDRWTDGPMNRKTDRPMDPPDTYTLYNIHINMDNEIDRLLTHV